MTRLPNELWLAILRLALRPDEYLDGIFDAKQLDHIVRILATNTGNDEATRASARRKRDLRLVCRLWEVLVSSINNVWVSSLMMFDDHQAPSVSIEGDSSRGPETTHLEQNLKSHGLDSSAAHQSSIDTEGFDGVRITHYAKTDSLLQFTYSHPIRSLILQISVSRQFDRSNLQSLSHVICHPNSLQVLHLRIRDNIEAPNLFSCLEDSVPHLNTLSLDIWTPNLMPHKLCIPSLRTLILALPVYAGYRYNIDWTAFNWTFPALQHLSVDQTGYSESFIIDIFPPFPVFYERLLERHQEQIVSLRMNPPYPELSNVNSLVAWMKFPRLEAFATNFEQKLFATMPTTKEDLQMAGLPDQPIPLAPIGLRHLVQISHKDLNIKPIILGLVRCIEICAGLETITLPGAILKMLHKYHKVAADFKGLCEERNLKILNRDGEAVSLPLNTVSS